ncbi:hypothetical protein CY34DRAFT_68441, partial [Suillus luteus UH-Slu-Lm8-n1]
AYWTEDHIPSLIKFLAAHKSEASDEMNFKIGVFQAMAAHFLELLKDMSIFFQVLVSQCNSHFQIQKQYKIVLDIKSQSGFSRFSWDNEFSASIDSTSEVVWAVYVKEFFLHSDAAPFRNKGWPYFNEVDALL